MRAWLRRDWWRSEPGQAFARELGTIVLGVLVALAIGEAADAIRWRVRVHEATASMRTESAGNRFNLVERRLLGDCFKRRLTEIDAILQAAWQSGSLPPIAALGGPGHRPVETAAWEVAVADGTTAHMDRSGARDLALGYEMTRVFTERSEVEHDLWDTLSILEQGGRRIDANVLATVTEARARAARMNEDLTFIAGQIDDFQAERGIPVEWSQYVDLAGLERNVRTRPICRPLAIG